MPTRTGLASLLLFSTALVAPAAARAQTTSGSPSTPSAPSAATGAQSTALPADNPAQEQAPPDVSVPGGNTGDIVVTGRSNRNAVRSSTAVVSVLSTADIARTGEGDIAGALSRVTGLSVVGGGFVYVRGLGDRYSLALLNGSPLPSPEPLRRVIPLDIFPTNVIASSLVQKSYSVNFPGEFGGGVINLTTRAVPDKSFLSVSGGGSGDSQTTGKLGYVYYGSKSDWTGFDNGTRDTPPALRAFFRSRQRIGDGTIDTQAIASQIVTGRNSLLQRDTDIPANFSAAATGGTAIDIGGARLGIIATAGISNKWLTRDTRQQTPSTIDLSQKELDFERVITDNRIVVNGLLGLGLEFGDNRIRLTNLYIRDTLKQSRLGLGSETTTGFTRQDQNTAWYERQLIDTQLVGELKFGDLSLDLRGGYANTQREAPFELSYDYIRSNRATDPYGQLFINRLNNGQNGGASATFSNLEENLYSTGVDVSYKIAPRITATVGYAFSDTARRSDRRDFQFIAPSTLPLGVALLRPDYLLQPSVIKAFGINLVETTESDPAFNAKLRTNAGYVQLRAAVVQDVSIDVGVRYEKGKQSVSPVQVFARPSNSLASTRLNRDYFLPAATLTWEVRPAMQVRVSGSKTIARPQFRELIFQQYYDPDQNRQFRGNPLLTDSQLYNAEARYEYYFAPEQRFTLAGFYKKINHPIEAFTGFSDNQPQTSFANAPRATLYGAELETQKYFKLDGLGDTLAARRALVIANYTYTRSKINVKNGDSVDVFGTTTQPATNFFRSGTPLTGQSDHLVNLQLGLEETGHLSQQTILMTFASKRVTSRGAAGLPDIIEKPGFHLDFVAREGVRFMGVETEIKFEARNITGTKYQEYQQVGANRNYYNLYNVGTTLAVGVGVNF